MAKILIIEDEKILAEMYRDRFSQEGHVIDLAFNAEEGLKLAREGRPDLILLDIILPRENGIQFLKKYSTDKEISQIPIVAFSNYDETETKKEAFKYGIKAYLLKTQYTPKELLEELKKFLKEK